MVGTCALCLETRLLRRSHLLPAAVFKLIKNSNSGVVHPLHMIDSVIMSTSNEPQTQLLCESCEGRFSELGESWVIKNCFRRGTAFALHDMLLQTREIARIGDTSLRAGRENEGIDVDRLIFFAASVFWRASVWPQKWRHPRQTDLGPIHDQGLRVFLLGDPNFPSRMALQLLVATPSDATDITCIPFGARVSIAPSQRVHYLMIPGLIFALVVGNTDGDDQLRQSSLSAHPQGPIMLSGEEYMKFVRNLSSAVGPLRPVGVVKALVKARRYRRKRD
jgi:hypothetical protein